MLTHFAAEERRLLLSLPRIGPTVVQRIEAQGIASLQELRRLGVDRVVELVCCQVGNRAWANRRRALMAALDALGGDGERAVAPRIRRGRTAA